MRQISGSVAVSMVMCLLAPSALSMEKPVPKQTDIEKLVPLRGKEYVTRRDELVRFAGSPDAFKELKEQLDDWHAQVLCDALQYRKRKPEEARLLDAWWGGPMGLIRPPGGVGSDMRVSKGYGYVVALCFGPEATAIVVENLLHTWSGLRPFRPGASDALIQLRDDLGPQVLRSIACDADEDAVVRIHSILLIGDCLQGLAGYELPGSPPPLFGGSSFPKELGKYVAKRAYPPLTVDGPERTMLVESLSRLLSGDENVRVRAACASVLRHAGDEKATEALCKASRSDESSWVRAWCVVALRAIQGEAAAKCLVELKRQEKDPEVMKVLEGTGTPVHPKMGIPKDTILEEPINLGVDMEDNQKPQ